MEVNKQEARRAAAVGKRFLESGNTAKAVKFLEKSLRMFPAQPDVKSLLERAKSGAANGHASSASSSGSSAGPRRRAAASSASAASSSELPKRPYTPEQAAGVQRILKCKNFYDVLGVPREGATPAQIKKGYRKLALKFHPDKNGAPGADEAFKVINRAFSVLSDDEKKAHYDQFGDEEASPQQYQRRYYRQDDFDPDEIFNMFFGPGFARAGMGGPGVRMYTFGGGRGRRRGGAQGGQQQQGGIFQLLQLLPIIMLFFLSFFSFPQGGREPLFSLHRTSSYPIGRSTKARNVISGIDYYVKRDFKAHYGRDRRALAQIEQMVEDAKIKNVRQTCEREKQMKHVNLIRAKRTGNAAKVNQAHQFKTPACDELNKLYAASR